MDEAKAVFRETFISVNTHIQNKYLNYLSSLLKVDRKKMNRGQKINKKT